ncbi:peptidoglycan DD-metalloendopeptidase family protein [Enterococcus faecalis]|uniref:phage tail tip lysozyme n=1 Tax=Enterococcus TaxID=1350 RepID=UPI0016395565|nr:phage tail tip lysozyme [Enterococcus faecalis]EHH1613813.1 peptidoglycan DD-metalloendopeptidase family protein [Enterococcus faecalis]EIB6802818.1 peptidoglycan DD-metalloendopeptidase family protein [Enterococcus faecalis]EIQ7126009.1 peptidoglycan DD-metalloendopeptidase family protein [Enterococcus faecalis]EJR1587417.1 peptidoglycan DD-metalloendopeptidase family protein [Enterococcus faecalis]EKK5900914.1 peptidoglycan DD-metalloendopeptidase family protein [Enterococcus faecalis]
MTQNFIYAYTAIPENLNDNGMALPDWQDLPEINRVLNGAYRFYGNYARDGQYRSYLKKGNFLKAQVEDGSYQYFEIYNIKKNLQSVSVTARHIGFMANKNFIINSFTANGNGTQIMNNLKAALTFKQRFNYLSNVGTTHQFTAKQVGPIDAIIGSNNGNQNLTGVTGGELEMDNFNLKLVKQIGSDNGFRIDFGVNLEAIDEDYDDESIINSLFLIGGVPENDYDQDKEPITHGFLEIAGVNDSNRRIGKRENSECKTVEELKEWGQSLFDKDRIHEPKVTHTVSMVALEHTLEYEDIYEELSSLHFGDVAHVRAKEVDIEVTERMVEYTWFPTLGKFKDIVLGNDLSLYTSTANNQTQELKRKIDNRTETLVQNVLNATAWITGNSGGHVVFRPEKAPSEILIMDTNKIATAKRVWRWNLNGLGYSDNGVNGPFGLAMTSKGEIVADFIKVGIIDVNVLQTSFNKATGDVLKLVSGALQIWNEKTKIMELTKKGMEFWNGSSHIGTIGTKGNPFPGLVDKNGNPVISDGNSLLLVADNPQKIIGLSNQKGAGHIITGLTQLFVGNNFNFFGPEGSKATITVDRLIVGGKEVIPGDGSGGNDGDVPPELTTEKEKNAWAVWQFLKSKGYSEQAAAGILGNMDQESGIMPDIDEGGGGPGYGLVQWTSPIAGESGRAYVQRLLAQAGISGDYRNITTQLKLLDWHMHNGQYIPSAAYPYSVTEFKALTDIGTATMAFEANFERPAVTHPERIPLAQYWYDLLHNLKPGTNKWVNPVRSSYTITQEWDEIGWGTNVIHGGIDIASMPAGSMPPVYVARSGTVETVTYDGTGGNYVVIKHDDGYWTYYGHLDSVDLSVGDKVTTNSRVGIMGATGLASGVHLHFEVWKGAQWQRINPRDVINF